MANRATDSIMFFLFSPLSTCSSFSEEKTNMTSLLVPKLVSIPNDAMNQDIFCDLFPILMCIHVKQTKKSRVGLDLVHQELFGWLLFATGRAHLSDRLSRPHTSKQVVREEVGEV